MDRQPLPAPGTVLDGLRRAQAAGPDPDHALRLDRLRRLETALDRAGSRLVKAMSSDFGHRSAAESDLFDVTMSIADIRFARRHLRRWMRVRRAAVPAYLWPARAWLRPQPLGVVGIIAPWNFPVYLTIGPLAMALAAGNRAMLKPSELAPATAEVLGDLVASAFAPDEVAVVTGGADVAAAFSALPFDHLLFTGSTAVGRKVAEAAASNLTPVTLELGGKSPAIVAPSADLDRAARRIAWGKGANAGQICIAPDHVLVHRPLMEEFLARLEAAFRRFYPEGAASADYSGLISERHRARLCDLLAEAEGAGVRLIRLPDGAAPGRKLAPVIAVDPPPHLRMMQEEIFGPLLPVVPFDRSGDAIARIATGPRPLALYLFAEDAAERGMWLSRTLSGGVTVNDTLLHVACLALPFGGVGASGSGSWHGEDGFRRFSHMKPVLEQSRWNGSFLMEPPFRGLKARGLRAFRRIV